MNTHNIYSLPLDEDNVKKVLTESPAHRKYRDSEGFSYDLTNAIDFLCKEGTPVNAALDGEVVKVVSNLTKNYDKMDPPKKSDLPENQQDGNYVLIKHRDNEFSIYSHLGKGKIMVDVGENVKAGQLIGLSGNTGWSIKPHLHFMIFRFLKKFPAKDLESLEIVWKD
jgi:murein DD-endopeptidase MepM/ murein hydrolase activator NlpD